MGHLFIAIGLAILAVLLWQPPAAHLVEPNDRPPPGLSASGSGVLTSDEIEPSRQAGNRRIDALRERAEDRARWANRLFQAAIVLGALVSIAAGLQRIARARERSDIALVTAIALCGAGSAVATSLGNHQDRLADGDYRCAGVADAAVLTHLSRLAKETDRSTALQLLEQVAGAAGRCAA